MRLLEQISAAAAALSFVLALNGAAMAASLSVSPVIIDVAAPQQTATLTLRNTGARPLTGQVRVFAWRQENGKDVLDATDAVVASPPLAEVRPDVDYTIRIVRNSTAPIAGEEAYRLVIDEVPDAAARDAGQIVVALRYSLPVFFFAPEAGAPRVSWSIQREEGKSVLAAHNDGDRHIKLTNLALGGKPVEKGAAGYVLGHSDRHWALSGGKAPASRNVTAVSEKGPINGSAQEK